MNASPVNVKGRETESDDEGKTSFIYFFTASPFFKTSHSFRSRSRSKDRHKRSKDRRRSKEKSSRRDRSRDRDRFVDSYRSFLIFFFQWLCFRKSRERSRRSRSHHRKSQTPPTTSAQRMEMSAAQQAQITQFLSASLSGLGPASTVHSIAHHHAPQPEPVRTDFSNLFHSISPSAAATAGPNATALAIAAQKAKDLLRAKKLNDKMKTASNGDSIASNGNESSRDGSDSCQQQWEYYFIFQYF